ncbi:NAD(P)-dependent alcohol dehydrogenase [Bradyrhizobium japonicum]|uniref:NAD(P)-dependent alcohol dehydrogenase n=1 Tax=Bradyrhizobium japonicum TaxID=375 RepID=UPI001BADA7A2|nr:NAD(P)-dependent alcohol dehydrogenase [Bradyrhizobium japonicum]MBR0911568.1 NAD(P)-dependent alcohol dehydrogenase [Bradyrhizobium japonicum]
MKITAAVMREKSGHFSLEEVELDDPRDDEVLVRIVSSGVCHTDTLPRDQVVPAPFPAVYGHEGAGVVVKVGGRVSKLKPGDHVVLSCNFCGSCDTCITGNPMYCRHFFKANFGFARMDGSSTMLRCEEVVHGAFFGQSSFATYALGTERSVVKIPSDVPLELMGPLGCGIQTGAGAVINSLHPKAGDSIAIYGAGSVGLSALLGAVVAGCAIRISVDPNEERLRVARELGATHVINPRETNPIQAIQDITGGGSDFSLEASGNLTALRQAVDSIKILGECGMIGAPPFGSEISLDAWGLLLGRKVRGICEGDSVPDLFIPKLVELYKQGRFPFDKLVKFYPFDQINQAVEDSEKGRTIKAVLTFQ